MVRSRSGTSGSVCVRARTVYACVCKDVARARVLLSGAATSDPALSSRFSTSACDSYAATCNGVRPSWSRHCTSAPASMRAPTTAACPQKAPQCKGATPIESFAFADTPLAISAATASALPCIADMVSASASSSISSGSRSAFGAGSADSRACERHVCGSPPSPFFFDGVLGMLSSPLGLRRSRRRRGRSADSCPKTWVSFRGVFIFEPPYSSSGSWVLCHGRLAASRPRGYCYMVMSNA